MSHSILMAAKRATSASNASSSLRLIHFNVYSFWLFTQNDNASKRIKSHSRARARARSSTQWKQQQNENVTEWLIAIAGVVWEWCGEYTARWKINSFNWQKYACVARAQKEYAVLSTPEGEVEWELSVEKTSRNSPHRNRFKRRGDERQNNGEE